MTDLLHNRCAGPAEAAVRAPAASPLSRLIGSATRILLRQFSPAGKAAFAAELRRAQADIEAFMTRGDATMSPSCRRLLTRFATALEGRANAVSADAHRTLVRDRRCDPLRPRRP